MNQIETIPQLLYRYRPSLNIEAFCTNIKDCAFFFSNPTTFNDPFDSHLGCDFASVTTEEWKKLASDKSITESAAATRWYQDAIEKNKNPDWLRYQMDRFWQNQRERCGYVGMLCLSRDPENVLMWAHYGFNSTGFLFEFSSSECERVWEVDYSHKKLTFYEFLQLGEDDKLRYLIATKTKPWEYETESRLVVNMQDKNDKGWMVQLRSNALKGIVLGANISAYDEMQIRTAISSLRPDLRIRKAVLNNDTSKIEIPSTP